MKGVDPLPVSKSCPYGWSPGPPPLGDPYSENCSSRVAYSTGFQADSSGRFLYSRSSVALVYLCLLTASGVSLVSSGATLSACQIGI